MSAKQKKSKRKSRKSKQNIARPAATVTEQCPHCVGGAETYGYLKRAFVYDVNLAREIVSDGREPVLMDPSDVAYCVNDCRIHEQHLDHVDPKYPGILAHLWGPGAEGTLEHGHLLIDGNHRAARCLRDGLPYRAYLLTEEESERILKRGFGHDGRVIGTPKSGN